MDDGYSRGIAFILEGATEKVFYLSFLKWIAEKQHYIFSKKENIDNGDIIYEINNGSENLLLKFNVVGTVTQISHSGKWFSNSCISAHKIPWTVFLCYDTDSSNNDISKFYQDDWKLLRNELKKASEIVDLAASAEIEDVMLCDLNGVCQYLGISVPSRLNGRKGKAKMKALFNSCGQTFHEGDRAQSLIDSLNFQTIIDNSPLNLYKLIDSIDNHLEI